MITTEWTSNNQNLSENNNLAVLILPLVLFSFVTPPSDGTSLEDSDLSTKDNFTWNDLTNIMKGPYFNVKNSNDL